MTRAMLDGLRILTVSQFGAGPFGTQVLADLGCGKIRLLTNNPRRVVGASGYGLHIVDCLPIRAAAKVVPLREQEG